MPVYTKLGSIPQSTTDGSNGWIQVFEQPDCPLGKEVVWVNMEWVIRDIKPINDIGCVCKWNHNRLDWIQYRLPMTLDSGMFTVSGDAVTFVTT